MQQTIPRQILARLQKRPNDGVTHDEVAVCYYQVGDVTNAIKHAHRAAALLPQDPIVLDHLGVILLAAEKPAEAKKYAAQAAQLAPKHPGIHLNLGNVLLRCGELPQAIEVFLHVGNLAPAEPLVWFNLGNALVQTGRNDEAITSLRRALELNPNFTEARRNLAIQLREQSKYREAADLLAPYSVSTPELAHLHGLTLLDLEDHAAALAPLQAASAFSPGSLETHLDLARCLRFLDRLDEAQNEASIAVRIAPDNAAVWNTLGLCCAAPAEAITTFRKALSIDPALADAAVNLARKLVDIDRLSEALPVLNTAIGYNPEYAELHYTLGVALFYLDRGRTALTSFDTAHRLRPDHVGTLWNRALCELHIGDFVSGWPDYEWRWKNDNREERRFTGIPEWPDAQPADGHLLVWGEQGVGDEVMFASMLPELKCRVPRITFTCTPRLAPLFRRSFPGIEIVEQNPDRHYPDPKIEADWQIPAGSLPRHLWTQDGPPGAGTPFLVPNPDLVGQLQQRYKTDGRPVIGIAWRSTNKKLGAQRSIPASTWAPILRQLPVRFVSLQYGDCTEAIATAKAAGMDLVTDETIDQMNDLDGFAAQVAAMDAVFTIDNSTVHFAGALGRPTWALMPTPSDWRWLEEGATTHWYRSVRILRRPYGQEWAPYVSAAAGALAEFFHLDCGAPSLESDTSAQIKTAER